MPLIHSKTYTYIKYIKVHHCITQNIIKLISSRYKPNRLDVSVLENDACFILVVCWNVASVLSLLHVNVRVLCSMIISLVWTPSTPRLNRLNAVIIKKKYIIKVTKITRFFWYALCIFLIWIKSKKLFIG